MATMKKKEKKEHPLLLMFSTSSSKPKEGFERTAYRTDSEAPGNQRSNGRAARIPPRNVHRWNKPRKRRQLWGGGGESLLDHIGAKRAPINTRSLVELPQPCSKLEQA